MFKEKRKKNLVFKIKHWAVNVNNIEQKNKRVKTWIHRESDGKL